MFNAPNLQEASRLCTATIDTSSIITELNEKPKDPKTKLCTFSVFYIGAPRSINFLNYADSSPKKDGLVYYFAGNVQKKIVRGIIVNGKVIDCGIIDSYELAKSCFG